MNAPLNIFVDVDDTLVRHAGTKRLPMPAAVRCVRDLSDAGMQLYCRSAGRADRARKAAEELGMAGSFEEFLPKPNVILEDQPAGNWPRTIHIYPAQCEFRIASDLLQHLRGQL